MWTLSTARFFKENFSHRHCEHREAIQKPQYLWAFQRFCLALDPYFTSSNFAILPPKSPFLPSPSPIHANTPAEGTHVPNPSIYLGFRGLLFFDAAFFRERKAECKRNSKRRKLGKSRDGSQGPLSFRKEIWYVYICYAPCFFIVGFSNQKFL